MVERWTQCWLGLFVLLLMMFKSPARVCAEEGDGRLVQVTLSAKDDQPGEVLTGRVLVQAQDGGILFEERHGELHNLTPDRFTEVRITNEFFRPYSADALAGWLTAEMGPAFGIHRTEHFILCTSASDAFTEYCGELLEEVYSEFYRFFADTELKLYEPSGPLPVVLFRRQQDLHTHAARQHPETTFEGVAGYYTVRFNQMYVSDIPDADLGSARELTKYLRQQPRHTETIVHETVHLLGYNSGLHTRLADNPLWFTEGLAAWFEPSNGRGSVLWNGPGNTNGFHVRRLKSNGSRRMLPVSLTELLADNHSFLQPERTLDAYAASWAVVYYLMRQEREAFDRLAQTYQQRVPLREVDAASERAIFAQACDIPLKRLEARAASTVSRLRGR